MFQNSKESSFWSFQRRQEVYCTGNALDEGNCIDYNDDAYVVYNEKFINDILRSMCT